MRRSNVSASGSAPPSMRLYPGIAAAEIEARMIERGGPRSPHVRWHVRALSPEIVDYSEVDPEAGTQGVTVTVHLLVTVTLNAFGSAIARSSTAFRRCGIRANLNGSRRPALLDLEHVPVASNRRAGKAACSPFRCCSGAARRARRQAPGGQRRIVQCVSSRYACPTFARPTIPLERDGL